MDPISTGLLVVGLPGALAAATTFFGRRWWPAPALGIGLASAAGAIFILGLPELWPVVAGERFTHVVAVAVIAALVIAWRRRALVAASLGVGLAGGWLVIGPLLEHRYPGASGWLRVVVGAGTLTTYLLVLRGLHPVGDRLALTIGLVGSASATASAGLSGTIVVAQLGAATTAALGGVWLASMVLRADGDAEDSRWRTVVPFVAVANWAVIALATLYASMSGVVAALNLLAPLFALAAVALLGGRRGKTAAVVCALVFAGLAVASSAGVGGESDTVEDDYGYGYE